MRQSDHPRCAAFSSPACATTSRNSLVTSSSWRRNSAMRAACSLPTPVRQPPDVSWPITRKQAPTTHCSDRFRPGICSVRRASSSKRLRSLAPSSCACSPLREHRASSTRQKSAYLGVDCARRALRVPSASLVDAAQAVEVFPQQRAHLALDPRQHAAVIVFERWRRRIGRLRRCRRPRRSVLGGDGVTHRGGVAHCQRSHPGPPFPLQPGHPSRTVVDVAAPASAPTPCVSVRATWAAGQPRAARARGRMATAAVAGRQGGEGRKEALQWACDRPQELALSHPASVPLPRG